jgi:fatty-acyl-CoA synthase
MRSTMQDYQLTVGSILRHGTSVNVDGEVITATPDGTRTTTYAELGGRIARLANALRRLGVSGDQRVGTFCWNNAEHVEAYLAVPAMGAVLHTLNIRLFPEQLVYIANHAEDKVVVVDDSLVGLLAKHLAQLETVEHVLVAGPDAANADLDALKQTGKNVALYEDALAAESDEFDWPELDERDAAAMCYTSGTTGNPKGVVYSHRSSYLHSMAVAMGNAAALTWRDTVLPIVPMFHANAWGLVYAAIMSGSSLAMPDRWLQAEPLVRFMQATRPTVSGAVPTVWNEVLIYLDEHPDVDFSDHLRLVLCGGSAVPVALQKGLAERHGIMIQQAWGMTETSPIATVALPPRSVGIEDDRGWEIRGGQGRFVPGCEGRLVGESGDELPTDGDAVGEIEVRGPWVTGSYYKDPDPEKFHDGWLRTGDVGTLDPLRFVRLTDRAKDVIKSGGEWISSVDLENALMAHPDVLEAAVVGIPDEKWQERPLASVVLREGASATPAELRDHLARTVAKWQLPDGWAFIDAVPRTSVGKFDKKVIRKWYADGQLEVKQA